MNFRVCNRHVQHFNDGTVFVRLCSMYTISPKFILSENIEIIKFLNETSYNFPNKRFVMVTTKKLN